MTDIVARIELLIEPQATLASGQAEGMPGIVSDSAYRLGWFSAGAWRLAALHGTSESFADVTLTGLAANAIPRLNASKKTVASQLTDDGATVALGGQALKKKSFACIYRTGNASAQSIPAGAPHTKIMFFTANMPGNIGSTPDYANNQIVVDRAGVYMVGFTRTFYTGTANVTWQVAVFVDGVIVPQSIQAVKVSNSNTPIYADLNVPVVCVAGSVIDFRVLHDNMSAAVTIIYQHATLYAQAID